MKLKIEKLSINTMKSLWVTPKLHKVLKQKALDYEIPAYKLIIMMLEEYEKVEERDRIDLHKHNKELKRLTNK